MSKRRKIIMDKVRVYNRSNSLVHYTDSSNNRLRMWEPIVQGIMSYKDLEYEELERVLNDYGTRKLFQEYLLIKDSLFDLLTSISVCPNLSFKPIPFLLTNRISCFEPYFSTTALISQ